MGKYSGLSETDNNRLEIVNIVSDSNRHPYKDQMGAATQNRGKMKPQEKKLLDVSSWG